MAKRGIIILPDKRLRLVSKPVAKVDAATRKLVDDMFATMYAAPGIGLAAIQVGEPRRIITLDLAKKDQPRDPRVIIDEITSPRSADWNTFSGSVILLTIWSRAAGLRSPNSSTAASN